MFRDNSLNIFSLHFELYGKSENFSESLVKLVQDYRGTSEHPFSLDAPNIRSPHEHILEPIQYNV